MYLADATVAAIGYQAPLCPTRFAAASMLRNARMLSSVGSPSLRATDARMRAIIESLWSREGEFRFFTVLSDMLLPELNSGELWVWVVEQYTGKAK